MVYTIEICAGTGEFRPGRQVARWASPTSRYDKEFDEVFPDEGEIDFFRRILTPRWKSREISADLLAGPITMTSIPSPRTSCQRHSQRRAGPGECLPSCRMPNGCPDKCDSGRSPLRACDKRKRNAQRAPHGSVIAAGHAVILIGRECKHMLSVP